MQKKELDFSARRSLSFTEEQNRIFASENSIRINAVAGSGKTTTLIEYARRAPQNKRILYLAFNKSVKDEARVKFAKANVSNVQIETAHSLAYKAIVIPQRYEVSSHSPIAILSLFKNRSADSLVLATHALRYASLFCGSTAKKVEELNYLETLSTNDEIDFITKNRAELIHMTRHYLAAQVDRRIPLNHDLYLKLFQLKQPQLGFDIILFDEAQDASPVMVDIIKKQKSTVSVVVGDSHQQIYSWRHAVNAMELFPFPIYNLSSSFRFGKAVADLAKSVIKLKSDLSTPSDLKLDGRGDGRGKKLLATLGRTNLSLLISALDYIKKRPKSKIYFEGHINSYLFGKEGGALSDVLNIHHNKREYIRDQVLKTFNTLKEVDDYAKNCGDKPLQTVVQLVCDQGDDLPKKIALLRKAHLPHEERENAQMIFSTIHRCKGMEYDIVTLCNDFITEKNVKRIAQNGSPSEIAKTVEEINILYVAITRAKSKLNIPKDAIPEDFINIDKKSIREISRGTPTKQSPKRNDRAELAGKPWTREEDEILIKKYREGKKIFDLASFFKRSPGAISSRLRRIEERDGELIIGAFSQSS